MPFMEQRRNRRCILHTEGTAQLGEQVLSIHSHNISLTGCVVELSVQDVPEIGTRLRISLPNPGLMAESMIRWVREAGGGVIHLGLQFNSLEFFYQPLGDTSV